MPMSGFSQAPQRRRAGFSGILVGAVLALFLVGTALWLFSGFSFSRWMDVLRVLRTRIDVSQPTVVRQIRQLQRLETVSYTMDKIITGERSNPLDCAVRPADSRRRCRWNLSTKGRLPFCSIRKSCFEDLRA